jgi:hypothetical protein
MVSPNEFWLVLHGLAETHDAEGYSPKHRAENIVNQFRQMPYVSQREFLADLVRVGDDIRMLQPFVTAVAQEAESNSRLRIAPKECVA